MRAVLVIDMQDGMADRIRAGRMPVNPDAPDRIAALLAQARGAGLPVIHVHHDDPHPDSPFRKGLPLDIDVLLYGQQVGDFDGLILPRAEILKNAFVLWPLALHAPQVLHPGVQRSFADLWQTAQIAQQLQPIAFQWRGHELTPAELILAHSGA